MSCFSCSQNLCTIYLDCENNTAIDLNYPAPQDGNYVLYLKYQNICISYAKTFTSGENIIFDLSYLNEDYCYSFHVQVNGEVLFVNNGDKSYDNFTFCTRKEWKIS